MMGLIATAALLSCSELHQLLIALEAVEMPEYVKKEVVIELRKVSDFDCPQEAAT